MPPVFDHSEHLSSPEFILPEKLVVSMVTWEMELKVHSALQGVMPSSNCPPSHLFVPESLRFDIIQWGHCSKVACHPGVRCTLFIVKQSFWWQSMTRDTQDFVLVYSVCTTSSQPPAAHFHSLQEPGSTFVLDFVTYVECLLLSFFRSMVCLPAVVLFHLVYSPVPYVIVLFLFRVSLPLSLDFPRRFCQQSSHSPLQSPRCQGLPTISPPRF